MIAQRLLAVGVAMIFVGAANALKAAGVEDGLSYCVGAAAIAILLTWVLSS